MYEYRMQEITVVLLNIRRIKDKETLVFHFLFNLKHVIDMDSK